MPLVIHPRVRKAVGRLAATTAVAMFATTGAAFASCPPQPTSNPFAQFGDTSSYFLAPGGSFEGSAPQVGWSLANASLVAGNEPFYVDSSTDSQSLQINGGGVATSPTFCIDSTMPFFRFFTTQSNGGSDLQVQLLIKQGPGVIGAGNQTVADLPDGSASSWTAVSPIAIGLNLVGNASVQAQLRFRVPSGAGSWQVDDVYVDPYRAG